MKLPKTTKRQNDILDLIEKFRFIDRVQIQKLLGHKYHMRVNTWLKDLTDKNYLTRIYSNKLGENTKPAIYYASKNLIRNLRQDEKYDSNYLKSLYRENQRSKNFIEKHLFIADICLEFEKPKFPVVYRYQTQSDFMKEDSDYYFLYELMPDLLFIKHEKKNTSPYILVTLDTNTKKYIIRKKIKDLVAYYFTNEWEEETGLDFPTVLFACSSLSMLIYAKKVSKTILDDYQDPEELELWFTTSDRIKTGGITAPVWEEI